MSSVGDLELCQLCGASFPWNFDEICVCWHLDGGNDRRLCSVNYLCKRNNFYSHFYRLWSLVWVVRRGL